VHTEFRRYPRAVGSRVRCSRLSVFHNLPPTSRARTRGTTPPHRFLSTAADARWFAAVEAVQSLAAVLDDTGQNGRNKTQAERHDPGGCWLDLPG
jgi:hypothetical protein